MKHRCFFFIPIIQREICKRWCRNRLMKRTSCPWTKGVANLSFWSGNPGDRAAKILEMTRPSAQPVSAVCLSFCGNGEPEAHKAKWLSRRLRVPWNRQVPRCFSPDQKGSILTILRTWQNQIDTTQIPMKLEQIKIIKGIIKDSTASPSSR